MGFLAILQSSPFMKERPASREIKKMKKLSKNETIKTFYRMAKEYGVLDSSKSGGGHDRFRLGKVGSRKALFLACSRVGWMCVYIDKNEKNYLENNGFPCEPTSGDENYEYKTRVDDNYFGVFLKLVQIHLGR